MPTLTERLRDGAWPAATRFLAWWRDELGQLIPGALLQPLRARGSRAVLVASTAETVIERVSGDTAERYVEATPLPRFTDAEWDEAISLADGRPIQVVLTPALVHRLSLRLPRAAGRHLATAIPLQLLDHAPILPRLLTWRTAGILREGKVMRVDVVIVRTVLLDAIAAAFAVRDRPSPAIIANIDGRRTLLRRGRGRQAGCLSRSWQIAIAILLATPVLVLIALQIAVGSAERHLDTARIAAEPRIAAERHLRVQADTAADLRSVLAHAAISNIVEDLAMHVPRTVHATDLALDGKALTFTLVGPAPAATVMSDTNHLAGIERAEPSIDATGNVTVRYKAVPR